MKTQARLIVGVVTVFLPVVFLPRPAMAEDEAVAATTNSASASGSEFGLFDWLDHRSAYYQDAFPQPLVVDDTSLEQEGELELSSLDTGANAQRTDIASAELQKSFGLVTFELALPYERYSDEDDVSQGIGNINLGARCPVFQFVSANGFFDSTLGAALEAGIPVNSEVSKNAELDPSVFDDIRLGEHFTLQSILGYSSVFGGGDEGGLQSFEYGFAFAYVFRHSDLPLPGVKQLNPLFELSGETGLNQDEAGQNSLLGSIGFRVDFKPIGDLEPSFGLGYVFPVDSGAREEVHWGIATSLVFDF